MVRTPIPGVTSAALSTSATVAAASYLTAVAGLFGNIQPVVLGAIGDALKLSNERIGYLAAIFMLVSAGVKLTAPGWITRPNQRFLCVLAVSVGAIAMGAVGVGGTWTAAWMLLALFGLAEGVFGAVSYALLGNAANPARAYAVAIGAQMVLAAASALALTMWIEPKYGYTGTMATLALIIVSGVLAALSLPARIAPAHCVEPPRGGPLGALLPLAVAVAALMTFIGAVMAVWTFSGRFATSVGIGLTTVGVSLAIASAITAVSAFVAAAVSGRVSSVLVATVGALLIVVSIYVMGLGTERTFGVALGLLSFGWGLAQPFYNGILREVDATDRLFVAMPAFFSVGIATGSSLGGVVADRFGFHALMIGSASFLILSTVLLALAKWLRSFQRLRAVSG